MNNLKYLILALPILVSACSTYEPEPEPYQKTISIEHYKVPCTGGQPNRLCLYGGEADHDSSLYKEGIQGFAFQWGHRYELEILVTPGESAVDLPDDSLSLVRVVKDTVVREKFSLELAPEWILEYEDFGFGLVDIYSTLSVPVTCLTMDVCDFISSSVRENEKMRVQFVHNKDNSGLIAEKAEIL